MDDGWWMMDDGWWKTSEEVLIVATLLSSITIVASIKNNRIDGLEAGYGQHLVFLLTCSYTDTSKIALFCLYMSILYKIFESLTLTP